MKHWLSKGRTCSGCSTPISNNSSSGKCRQCFVQALAEDSAVAAKKSASLKRYHTTQEGQAAHRERCSRAGRTRMRDAELRERSARIMREKVQPLSVLPENLAKRDYALTGRRSGEAKLAWCPPEYREQYRSLTVQMLGRGEAKRIIKQQIAKDKARAEALLTPFERQLRAVERGRARVIVWPRRTAC